MIDCPTCGQPYDQAINDVGHQCYACVGNGRIVEGAGRLQDLPPHQVTEEGINIVGQNYHRLRYVDGSEDLLDSMND